MQIAFLIYPGFTILDVIGPFQTLTDAPGHEAVIVAAEAGPVVEHSGRCQLVAEKSIDEVTSPDVILVSGGKNAILDDRLTEWIRNVHPTTTWTTSVCTGSIYLAAAGLLDGLNATTHWAWADRLNELGAHYVHDRIVQNGKIITAAGVSSGIDMGLTLLDKMYGADMAQMIQLGIEYDPQPPYDTGSPLKAPEPLIEMVQSMMGPTSEWAKEVAPV